MFTLFVLLSVASAAEYLFIEHYPVRTAEVFILNQCQNYKDANDAEKSMKLTFEDGKLYENYFTAKNCPSTETPTKEEDSTISGKQKGIDFFVSTELPKHKFYRVDDIHTETCKNIQGSLHYIIIYDECVDVQENDPSYAQFKSMMYEKDGNKIILQKYPEVGCTGNKIQITDDDKQGECNDACEIDGRGSMKIICGSLEPQPSEEECNYFFVVDPELAKFAVSGIALNECVNFVDNDNNEVSTKAEKNGNTVNLHIYQNKDCTGTPKVSETINIPAKYKCAKNLPDYLFKIAENGYSRKCTTNDKSLTFKLIKDECTNYVDSNKSFKYVLNDDVIYMQEYSALNCEKGKEKDLGNKPITFFCGQCQINEETLQNGDKDFISADKYVCNPAKQTPDATCKYLVETSAQEPEMAHVEEMDKCYNFKKENIEMSLKYTRVGNKRLIRYFSGKDCKLENIDVEESEFEGSEAQKKCAAELPAYVVKALMDPFSTKCTYADEMPRFDIILEKCEKQEGTQIYIKYAVVDNKVVQKPYSDAECKTEIKDQTPEDAESLECDKCEEDENMSVKFVCFKEDDKEEEKEKETSGSVAMTILAFFLIIAFLF